MPPYDVVIATDLTFGGGNSTAALEEIHIQHALGLRTGVYHLPSRSIVTAKSFHPGFARALIDGECELLNFAAEVTTKLLIFRHPSVVDYLDAPLPAARADRVVLIINAPPVNIAGKILYLLPYARARLRSTYGTVPSLCPVGPVVRAAVEKYHDGAPLQEPWDWVEVFDLERFAAPSRAPHDPIRIGRHSRAEKSKWPDSAGDILDAYPERSDIDVRILGGAAPAEALLGRRPANWTVYEFGSRSAEDFLQEIDVFVYHHHPKWVEAFGRILVEAAASGLPLILPPHFEPLTGDAAMYADPEHTAALVERMRDPALYALRSRKALEFSRRFSWSVHVDRLARLGVVERGTPVPSLQARHQAPAGWLRRGSAWHTSFLVPFLSAEMVRPLHHLRDWLSLVMAEPRPQLLIAESAVSPKELEKFQIARLSSEHAQKVAGQSSLSLRQGVIGQVDRHIVTIPNTQCLVGREGEVKRALLSAYCHWATSPPRDHPTV